MGFKDIVKNQNYITEWVENFIQNGVKHTDARQIGTSTSIEDAIQNGVKETKHNMFEDGLAMEETIQNGVKETQWRKVDNHPTYVDKIISK